MPDLRGAAGRRTGSRLSAPTYRHSPGSKPPTRGASCAVCCASYLGAILESSVQELEAERREDANPGLFDDELVAYALEGALGNMQMRASWDGTYGKRDVMRTFVAMYMAVRAAYAGRVDLMEEWAAVAELVDKLAASAPRPPRLTRHAAEIGISRCWTTLFWPTWSPHPPFVPARAGRLTFALTRRGFVSSTSLRQKKCGIWFTIVPIAGAEQR